MPPSRNLGVGNASCGGHADPLALIVSAGARKEKLRQREFARRRPRARSRSPTSSCARRRRSRFSTARRCPRTSSRRPRAREIPAVALVDAQRRLRRAAVLQGGEGGGGQGARRGGGRARSRSGGPSATPRRGEGQGPPAPARTETSDPPPHLLVENRAGYRNLCRLITAGALGKPKGEASVTWDQVAAHAEGLHVPDGRRRGAGRAGARRAAGSTRRGDELERLAAIFPGRAPRRAPAAPPARGGAPQPGARRSRARGCACRSLATNGVRYARAEGQGAPRRPDVHPPPHARSTRAGTPARRAARAALQERRRDGARSSPICRRRSTRASELAARLDFTLADLGYRFPEYPLPPGETPSSYLRQVDVERRARALPAADGEGAGADREGARDDREARSRRLLPDRLGHRALLPARDSILVQGRGSAANSAVCYALSITAVDPVKMELLFERFLSEERGEWPDIDLDLPSGDQRERVIQHVYAKYGPHGAGMTANVITYRDRSAAREVGKALGLLARAGGHALEAARRLELRRDPRAARGADGRDRRAPASTPRSVRARHFLRLFLQIQNLPRHLGQHSGGMVVAAGRLDEVVPLEPASMPGRVVVQWDKDDCADLGIVKVDLLGLGMLAAIEEAIPMIRDAREDRGRPRAPAAGRPGGLPDAERGRHGRPLPGREPRADGVAAAQRADDASTTSSCRSRSSGPGRSWAAWCARSSSGGRGKAPVEYPHPCLEPILKRTLGVPLFQEQLLRIAMVAAGFTGGEAEELRRAMGFKRSVERMDVDRGAAARGHDGARHRRGRRRTRSSSRSRRSRSTASPSRTPRASR